MRVNEVVKLVGGAIAIYAVMAACSAASGPQGFASKDGGGGTGSSGGAGDGSGGILDALTDPTLEANADPSQSGTRLKLQYYAGSDGSKQTAGMYDSMLHVPCAFGAASDGKVRCLPTPSLAVTIYTQSYFADASCSQALGVSAGFCMAPAVIVSSVTNNCTTTNTSYQAGPQWTGPLYESSSGCTAVPSATQTAWSGAGLSFYTLGAQIQPPDPTTFVEATLQTEP